MPKRVESGFDKTVADSVACDLDCRMKIQLPHEVSAVGLHCLHADAKQLRGPAIRVAFGQ